MTPFNWFAVIAAVVATLVLMLDGFVMGRRHERLRAWGEALGNREAFVTMQEKALGEITSRLVAKGMEMGMDPGEAVKFVTIVANGMKEGESEGE